MDNGPLQGLRIIELAGHGPGPHAAMVLGDWGAEVIRVVRPNAEGGSADWTGDAQLRNRTIVVADLKAARDPGSLTDWG
jgi:alpha-methylacyl-CoA racemase